MYIYIYIYIYTIPGCESGESRVDGRAGAWPKLGGVNVWHAHGGASQRGAGFRTKECRLDLVRLDIASELQRRCLGLHVEYAERANK